LEHSSDWETRAWPTGSTATGTPSARSVSRPSRILTRAHSSARSACTESAGTRLFRVASAEPRVWTLA